METILNKTEKLAATIKEYADNRIEYAKISFAEKASGLISNLVTAIFMAFVFSLFLIFGGIALAIGLGNWIENSWLGFLIVASLYLLAGVLVWSARGRFIQVPVMNSLIKQLFKNDDDDEN